MTTQLSMISKSTGLVKTGDAIRQLAARVERARQSRNEKIVRADAEYYAALERAMEAARAEGADASSADAPPAEPSVDAPGA